MAGCSTDTPGKLTSAEKGKKTLGSTQEAELLKNKFYKKKDTTVDFANLDIRLIYVTK